MDKAEQQKALRKYLHDLRQAHANKKWDALTPIDRRINQLVNQLKAQSEDGKCPEVFRPLMDTLIDEYRAVIKDCSQARDRVKEKMGNMRHSKHAMEAYKVSIMAGERA